MSGPDRLAVYGSLAPGRVNHHVVAEIPGRWESGTVRGVLHERGWGAPHGFPGLAWDPAGPRVPVQVLTSPALKHHLPRIDAFEGPDYRRVVVPVNLAGGESVEAWIYVIAPRPAIG